jgi:hypothetical protein
MGTKHQLFSGDNRKKYRRNNCFSDVQNPELEKLLAKPADTFTKN